MRYLSHLTGIFLFFACINPIYANGIFDNIMVHQLPNGLTIIIAPNNLAPVAKQTIIYKVGAIDEPAGQSGIAHLLEHLMFKGTKKYPKGEFSQFVSYIGGNENASTTRDNTRYFQIVPNQYVRDIMQREADRMQGLLLLDKEIEVEKQVVISERLQRVDNEPTSKLVEKMQLSLFANHPYRLPLIGFEHEIANITPAQLRQFYRQYYHPNNAILVITGAVEPKQILQWAREIYGVIPAKPLPKTHILTEPPVYGSNLVEYKDKNQASHILIKQYIAPNIKDNLHIALSGDIIEDYLNDRRGKLQKILVEQLKILDGVEIEYNNKNRGLGSVLIYGYAKNIENPSMVMEKINETLQQIANEPINEKEINAIKSKIQDRFLLSLDEFDGLANFVSNYMALGYALDDIKNIPTTIDQLTPAQIQSALVRIIITDNNGVVWGYTHP